MAVEAPLEDADLEAAFAELRRRRGLRRRRHVVEASLRLRIQQRARDVQGAARRLEGHVALGRPYRVAVRRARAIQRPPIEEHVWGVRPLGLLVHPRNPCCVVLAELDAEALLAGASCNPVGAAPSDPGLMRACSECRLERGDVSPVLGLRRPHVASHEAHLWGQRRWSLHGATDLPALSESAQQHGTEQIVGTVLAGRRPPYTVLAHIAVAPWEHRDLDQGARQTGLRQRQDPFLDHPATVRASRRRENFDPNRRQALQRGAC
mmetsp:Transcript_57120/g.165511  ORF Transcript_57120/g.165511 Transcript_57120/m.165511 type:complete len:264 (+) Transcript_57120:204-995(+)